MPVVRAVAVAFGVSLFAAPALGATATSHALLFRNSSGSVTCGVKIHAPNKKATTVLCGAKGIPRPKHGGGIGDPFVQISGKGKAQLVLISQNSYVGNKAKVLTDGTKWTSLGVSCSIGSTTVTCKNKSNHGFTIGNGKYKAF
jgi:hypothetical protein